MSISDERTGTLPQRSLVTDRGLDDDEPPGKPRRHPIWRNVSKKNWDDWRWQSQNAIRSVRQLLGARGQLSTAALAKELGLSARTLQRRLEEAGSSLRTERARHVSLQVEELLAGTQLDLDAIAAKVGLASGSHLVRHFRGTHGMTPGQWRELRKQRG